MKQGDANTLIRFVKTFLTVFVFVFAVNQALFAADSVKQWDVFEVALPGTTNGNPFTDVQFSATFSNSTSVEEVAGFYDGDGVYRVRSMPDEQGTWRYVTHSNRAELDGKSGTFEVLAPADGSHGPVRVANTYHFAY